MDGSKKYITMRAIWGRYPRQLQLVSIDILRHYQAPMDVDILSVFLKASFQGVFVRFCYSVRLRKMVWSTPQFVVVISVRSQTRAAQNAGRKFARRGITQAVGCSRRCPFDKLPKSN
jgi:hypothetical protein